MSKITIPNSMIDRIKREVITSILVDKKAKFDSKKDLKLSPIDHGVIADSVLDKIRTPEDGIDGKDGKDLLYSDEIRHDLIKEILPRISTPLDGSKGERGRKGEAGTSGKDYVLTDQDKLDISDITEKVTIKNVNRMLLKLMADIKSGKIKRANAGIGPKDALDLVNKALGNTDWQSGGGTDPITTEGDTIIGGAGGVSERLGIGSNGQAFISNGTRPVWTSLPGGGDMLKSVYNVLGDGVVDNSKLLQGQNSAYHLSRANHSGTQSASTISDFDTEVANETNVAANTTHRSSDGKNHSDVVLNNTHRGSDGTNHANVVLNDTHRSSDGKNHSDVVLNNTHRASDGKDHSDVVLNNSHRAVVSGNPHVVTKTEVGLANVDNLQQIPLTQKAAANGVASLDASSRIPAAQLPVSATEYKGAYNITTNTPTLADGAGTNGDLYRASVGGARDLGSGSITLVVGDALIYNGSIWEKIPSEDLIQSVNSQTGVVVLDTLDIDENTNLYYTEARVNANTNVSANTTHRSSDGKNHSDVVLNNTHRSSNGNDHSNVVLNNTHRGSDGSDHSLVNSAVQEADYDANTILAATSDDTPAALTVPVQTLLGRITAGNIDALTIAEVITMLFHVGTTAPTDTTRFWIDTN